MKRELDFSKGIRGLHCKKGSLSQRPQSTQSNIENLCALCVLCDEFLQWTHTR